jgi:Fe-Mn family superoxide dismutase
MEYFIVCVLSVEKQMTSRREFLIGAASALSASAMSGVMADSIPKQTLVYAPKPLSFNPAKLSGISEKLIVSHHDNNYAGAVKRLNTILDKIGALPNDAPPFMMGSLKREELIARNSMILHELYFGNLGGTGVAAGSVERLIARDFGSYEAWQHDFVLTGQSLSGGSGWVVLAYSHHDKRMHNVWMADHTVSLAGSLPLLIMDMYEHAYQMDYGADAKAYIDAFFKNINWEEVGVRSKGLA